MIIMRLIRDLLIGLILGGTLFVLMYLAAGRQDALERMQDTTLQVGTCQAMPVALRLGIC